MSESLAKSPLLVSFEREIFADEDIQKDFTLRSYLEGISDGTDVAFGVELGVRGILELEYEDGPDQDGVLAVNRLIDVRFNAEKSLELLMSLSPLYRSIIADMLQHRGKTAVPKFLDTCRKLCEEKQLAINLSDIRKKSRERIRAYCDCLLEEGKKPR